MQARLPIVAVVVFAALGLALVPAATAAEGDVQVDQAADGSATVTVTDNGTAVEGADVTVETTDENASYAGAGTYATDANGTVGLPAPETNVTVDVTATYDNASVGVSGTLYASEENATENATENETAIGPFGQLVSGFVHQAQNDTENGSHFGAMVANFVLQHNPAADKIPDHAGPSANGPPAHASGDENESDRGAFRPIDVGPPEHAGPPAHAGPSEDRGGPPEDRGPKHDEKGDEDDENERDEKGGGPPEHAG